MKKKRYVPAEKKSKKKYYVISIGLFFMLIMISSALNMHNEEEDVVEYKGHKFVKADNGWLTYLENEKPVIVLNNPDELKNLSINYVNLNLFNYLQKIYITYNPKERVRKALQEFSRELKFTPLMLPACTVDVPECSNLPLKDCNSTSSNIGVILFREANESNVYMDNNCLVIEGKELDKVVDKLILEQL